MIRCGTLLTAIVCSILGFRTEVAARDDLPHDILLMPYIDDNLLLVEDYLHSLRGVAQYESGALNFNDVFATFYDIDGDLVDELVLLLDDEVACDGERCDLFVFSHVNKPGGLDVPVNWRLDERTPVIVKRAMFERFALYGDETIRFDIHWPITDGRVGESASIDEFFGDLFDRRVETGSVRLSDVRMGTFDVNGDGQDEFIIYLVSPGRCTKGECGGHVLEVTPGEDGSPPIWRSIGRIWSADPVTRLIWNDAYTYPARSLRAINEVVDGYATLCSVGFVLRWNGEAYEDVVMSVNKAAGLGCPRMP